MYPASNYNSGDRDLAAHTPGWGLLTLLVFIVAALLALVLIPLLMKERTAELRRELFEVATPLAERWSEFVRTAAAKESAIRNYVHTGDEARLEQFRMTYAETRKAAAQLQNLARALDDEEVIDEAQVLLQTWRGWAERSLTLAEGELSRSEYQEFLPVHRAQYGALLEAERRFDRALDRAIRTRRTAIQQAENRWVQLTTGLAFMAVVAVGAVLWLGRHLYAANRRLEEYAREQTRLLRITQLLNEATDLDEALQRITHGVIELARAHGAHIEQINIDRGEIEVVSTAGKGTPVPGTTGPYSGSLAEKVITSGESEVVTVDAIVDNDRSVAPYRIVSRPGAHLLVVPLFSEDAALGALLLNRPATDDAFDADEITRIRVLADMAALVLQRLYLFEEMRRNEKTLRQRTDELHELNETLEERVEQRTAQIQELASQLMIAEQRERRRIAQVLHDDLQQRLYGIQLRMTFLRQHAKGGALEPLLKEIQQAEVWMDEAIDTTRRLSVDLSPPVLTQDGLVGALGWLKTQMKELHGLDVEIKAECPVHIPNKNMQVFLFQVVRELLFNVVKHAGTDRATVTIQEINGDLIVRVIDRGRGFDPDEMKKRPHDDGFGLRAARERLALLEGELEVDSTPGEGTQVTLRCPLNPGRHALAEHQGTTL